VIAPLTSRLPLCTSGTAKSSDFIRATTLPITSAEESQPLPGNDVARMHPLVQTAFVACLAVDGVIDGPWFSRRQRLHFRPQSTLGGSLLKSCG